MRQLWQWFCGYVQVSLRGRQVNRFLNLCSRNGISLWRVSYDINRMVRVHIRLKDFYEVKPFLKKTKTHLHVIKKSGFPFWCHRHPRLKWMFLVVFCVICMSFYSLSFVWDIQISGNEKLSTQEVLNYLEEQKIVVGIKRDEVNCTSLEHMLRKEFDQMGWVSVYMDHTSLCVEMKESLYEEFDDYPIDDGRGYHLVANKDALIHSIVTQAGTPVIKAGMTVKQGDVLVLGQCEIFDDIGEIKDVLQVQAQASVYGDVSYFFLEPLTEIEIFALKETGLYSNTMLEFIANHKLTQFIEKLEENGVIILDKNVMIDKKEKNIVFLGEIRAREQIGINIPVEEVREHEFE